jgi:hypothetical protein
MVAGTAVSRLPFLYEPNGNLAVPSYLATWILMGVIAGVLLPDRPWRWGAAMVLPLPILAVIFAQNPSEALLMQVVTLPLLPLMAVPIIVGAYCGRALSGARKSPPLQTAPGPSAVLQVRLILLAYILCTVPILFISSSSLLIVWAVAVAVSSALFAVRFQIQPLRSTFLAVAGVIGAFVTSVIYDSVRGGPDHNLLPFELWAVTILTTLVAVTSASLASWFRKWAL